MLMVAIFLAVALLVLARLVFLQVIVADEYSANASKERTATPKVLARRGTIYDRNGAVLAISIDATNVSCDPSKVTDPASEAVQIAAMLGGKAADYQEILSTPNATFAYLKRNADVDKAEKLKELKLDGVFFEKSMKREYPCGRVGAQVVGACDVDGNAQSGLEYYYDEILSGTDGQYAQERGRDGMPIPGTQYVETPAVDGQDIVISLDVEMQAAMEEYLEYYSEEMGVDTGSVMMDAGTGEIYAAASTPLFDPNNRKKVKEGATTLKSLTSIFEPGSVFKAVTALKLLESGSMGVDDTIYCPTVIKADDYEVTDAHERPAGKMSLHKIIAESSNIGVSLSTQKMGFEKLNEAIEQYGMNKATGVDYPGEPTPSYQSFDEWSRITGYNISFGQGIMETPLQMVRFYGAVANGGVACTPHFLVSKPQSNETPEYPTETIIEDKKAVEDEISLLEGVVEEGTGTPTQIYGFSPAGKTGTAEVPDGAGGYKKGVYNISFIGFLAHSTSKLVCYTGAYELEAEGNVSPIFRDIMTTAIDRYSIASK